MRTASYTDFTTNVKVYFNSVIDNCDSIVVNRDSENAAVLLSLEEYNSLMETLYLLSSPETIANIRQAEKDIKAGKGIEMNIDEL